MKGILKHFDPIEFYGPMTESNLPNGYTICFMWYGPNTM